MKTRRLIPTALALALSISQSGWTAPISKTKSIESLAEGPPAITSILGPQSFEPVVAEKLSHAAVWYLDYDWHRRHGVEIPPEGIHSPEFARRVLNAYGWQSRTETDDPQAFTGEKKTMYTDYYGGYGMGTNIGSGRAAGNGIVQAKGLKTSMAKDKDPWHSNGAVQSIEAVDEAIWSEVLDNEMKYGSNKVVAVILTGTYGKMKDSEQIFPRALIIREMGLRPAHFMLNYSRDPKADRARVDSVLPKLLDSLPYPEGYVRKNDGNDVRTGVMELVDREALAQAEYYAKRMFFGSVSPSNLEITGRRLDLGDHTAQEGYSPIYRLTFMKNEPFGTTGAFLEMFEDIESSLRKTLPYHLASSVPSYAQIKQRFNDSFAKFQRSEMVRLTGVPHEILDASMEQPSTRRLGEVLVKMSRAGHGGPQFTDPNGWENRGLFDVNAILERLGADPAESVISIRQLLNEPMAKNQTLKEELAQTYFQFRQDVKARAQLAGLLEKSLLNYFREASKLRNKSRPSLVRGHQRWRTLWDTTDKSIHEKTSDAVESYIEEQISKNVFNFKDAGPYRLVVEQKARRAEGLTLRQIFDARKGEYETVLRIDVTTGSGYFAGQKLSKDQLRSLSIEAKTQEGSLVALRPSLNGNYVEFTFPQARNLSFESLRPVSGAAAERIRAARASKAPMCAKVHAR